MNIEKTISEQAVSDILTPMLESQDRIVTEDVAPLFDQATGLDTPPASGTVTTTIEESRNLITAIIRKAWTATLTMLGGASVIGYITAAYTYLRTRLQGNETYGIPDRRSEISASSPLAANLALLNDRKIGDLGDVPDGMTVLQLYTGRNSGITKIKDTYAWDLCYKDQLYQLFNALPSLEDIYIRCKRLTGYSYGYNVWFPSTITKCNGSTDVFEMPDLERFEGSAYVGFPTLAQNFKKWSFPKMVYTRCGFSYKDNQLDPRVIDWVEEVYMPKCKTFGEYASENILANFTNLKTVIMGNVTIWYSGNAFVNDVNLIHLEVGADGELLDHSASYAGWNPTNALDASRTDLIEEGSTAQNNLQQFLENFRSFIADRLKGGYPIGQGPILTLSQAVRNAIHAAESTYGIENIIITQKGWTISPAPN